MSSLHLSDVTPYLILLLSMVAGFLGAKKATRMQSEAATAASLGDVLDQAERQKIEERMPAMREEWFRQLDCVLGTFLLMSGASAVQSEHPAVYAFTAISLIGAFAPIMTSLAPNHFYALRNRVGKNLYEIYYLRHLAKKYFGGFRGPIVFWLGNIAIGLALLQGWLRMANAVIVLKH